MSQDLFAAFGSDENHAGRTQNELHDAKLSSSGRAPTDTAVTTPNLALATSEDEEDDFGEFEDASNTGLPEAPSTSSSTARAVSQPASSPRPTYPPPRQTTKIPSAPPTTIASARPTYPLPKKSTPTSSKGVIQKASAQASKPAPEVGAHPFAGRMDFLFEADDDEYDAGHDEIADIASNPEAAMAYSKRVILEQQARDEAKKQADHLSKQGVPKQRELVNVSDKPAKAWKDVRAAKVAKADVLFDVEDESGWDDSLESHAIVSSDRQKAKPAASLPAVDLLALDQDKVTRDHSPVLVQDTIVDDDDWDDFEEAPSSLAAASQLHIKRNDASNHTPQPAAQQSRTSAHQAHQPPPINVPPPSVLLSIFPPLLESGNEALFNTLSQLHATQRQTLLSHLATHQFLRGYLALAMALAHIIAGRKLRWKRDSHLAQSMRIGPSVAGGGKGGMKLTGVDRGEVAKEDREVLDCIRLWKMQVGKLRSAVAGAISSGIPAGEARMPQVPEVAEQMIVKTLKVDEGGFTAPAACAICGLRREERVIKVDVEVEDSFGEWWGDGASCHAVCINFWSEHKEKLRSR